jgi:hypothetical protein
MVEDSSSSFLEDFALDDLIDFIIMDVRNPIKTLPVCYIMDKASASGDELEEARDADGDGSGSAALKSFWERLQSISVTS